MYINLVKQVREAFEVCELVRLNCKGMNRSDFKKIGAKLQVCYLNVCFIVLDLLKCLFIDALVSLPVTLMTCLFY